MLHGEPVSDPTLSVITVVVCVLDPVPLVSHPEDLTLFDLEKMLETTNFWQRNKTSETRHVLATWRIGFGVWESLGPHF